MSETKDKDIDRLRQERDRAEVEPIPQRLDFFQWLEGLFYEEPEAASFPQKIDICPVWGKQYENLRRPIMQKSYGPGGEGKPPRSKIVELSNQIIFRCQQDCDIQRKQTVYGVHVMHLARGPDYYERWLLRMNPTLSRSGDGVPRTEADDEPISVQERFSNQILEHGRKEFELYSIALEGIVDRLDRMVTRQDTRIQTQDARIEKLNEMLERALSLEEERSARREWQKLKVHAAQKGLDMGLALAPPLIAQLTGKQPVQTMESAESITLKKFLPREEGGELTTAQANTIFGIYDSEPPHEVRKQGILTFDQGKLIWEVATLKSSADTVDKLLPDGPLAISADQIARLQSDCGLEMHQLVSIHTLFEGRMNKKTPPATTTMPAS